MTKSHSSEPSMDDILASIRRAMNGDTEPATKEEKPEEPKKVAARALAREESKSESEIKSLEPVAAKAQPDSADGREQMLSALIGKLQGGGDIGLFSRGPTIEDLVRAELRPVLAAWVETHLPEMMERLAKQALADLLAVKA